MSRGASDGLDLRAIIVWVTVGGGRDYRSPLPQRDLDFLDLNSAF